MLNTVIRFSLWEVAHRWHNLDPESTNPQKLPFAVQDTLRSLAGANHYDGLMIVNCNGVENKGAYYEPNRHRYKHEEIEEELADCCRNKIFNKPIWNRYLLSNNLLASGVWKKGGPYPVSGFRMTGSQTNIVTAGGS